MLIHRPVSVAGEERIHIVEKAAPAINESGIIAVILKHFPQAEHVRVVRPFDHRAAGRRRKRERYGLQAPGRSCAGGKTIGEQ